VTIIKKVLRLAYHSPLILFGVIICKNPIFTKYKQHLLSTWHDYNKRSFIDNVLYPYFFKLWIRLEYLNESDPNKREELKGLAMGKNSGKKWAETYDSRPIGFNSKIGHMNFHEAYPIFSDIEDICKNTKRTTNFVVIQIGNSSGREIAYFATKFSTFEYIGIDIYKEVVDYSKNSHNHSNLSFELCSANNISQILSRYRDINILIYSSGSLQYVQPEHLCEFFRSIADYPNLKILISEPANESKGVPDELKRSIWRANFSYTHDYKYYAEEAGIETVKSKIIRPYVPYENFPMHRNTVHYYYSGKTKPK